MYSSFVIGNVLEKINAKTHNIIYYPQQNLTDHAIAEIDNNTYYIFGDNQISYSINNFIDLPNSYISLYNYNLSITNNILGYTHNPSMKKFHLNTIILTHSQRPAYIKKEDSMLMSQRLSRETKVFFSESTKESWKLQNSIVLNYGIPSSFRYIKPPNERKDVIVLNYENSPHAKQIQEEIIKNNYSCDIMNSCRLSAESINKVFNDYKVCVDLAEYNILNLLCGVAAGCVGVTLNSAMANETYANTSGLIFMNSIEEILKTIAQGLAATDSDRISNSNNVLSVYNFEKFKLSMQDIIKKANMEAFVL